LTSLSSVLLQLRTKPARNGVQPRSLDRAQAAIRSGLDALGLVATVYDARARLGYLADGPARARNASFRASEDYDGLPLPPPALVHAVAGHFDLREYYESGVLHADLFRRVLVANGFEVERFRSLLDFGCGCGRVLRQWRELRETQLYGCDYNSRLADWCRRSLPFAEFRVNELGQPLPYGRGGLDFVYAVSVFTHLTEPLQRSTMRALERVLAPGGVLLITTKGLSRLSGLNDEERERFFRGELVVQAERYAGRNLCSAFHPESYIRERLATGFDVLAFVPADVEAGHTQDLVLLQKPAEGSDSHAAVS
jgi:SAM-dependent methyltransferase